MIYYVLTIGDYTADVKTQHTFGAELVKFYHHDDENVISSDIIHVENSHRPYPFISNHRIIILAGPFVCNLQSTFAQR